MGYMLDEKGNMKYYVEGNEPMTAADMAAAQSQIAGQRMLTQGKAPAPTPVNTPAPTKVAPPQPQQKSAGLLDRIGGFFSDNSDMLNKIGAGYFALSQDPRMQQFGMQQIDQMQKRKQSNRTLEFLKARGVDEKTLKALQDNPQMINAYAASLLKQPKNAQSTIGKIMADYQSGAYGAVGSKAAIALRDRAMAAAEKAGSTQVSVSPTIKMGSEYGKEIGGLFAEEDIKTKNAADQASRVIPKLQETIALINDPNTNVGLFAGVQTGVDRVIAALGGRDAAQRLDQSELLNAYLGSDVFAALSALGLGSKNMDTPAEREFLREVMTGKVTNSRGSLKRMAEERLNAQMNALEKYNSMVERGEFNYTKGTPLESRFGPIELKPYEPKPSGGVPPVGTVRTYKGRSAELTGNGDPNLPPDDPNSAWKYQ